MGARPGKRQCGPRQANRQHVTASPDKHTVGSAEGPKYNHHHLTFSDMTNQDDAQNAGYNRRDFIKGGSVATLMTMLGGIELVAQTTNNADKTTVDHPQPTTVAVIGLGGWGKEILNNLARMEVAIVAGLCDTYEKVLKQLGNDYPKALKTKDYKEILANKDIKAVVVATPTHLHKDIVIDALKAGKHVYCEMPLAHTIEDARAIAEAAKAAPQLKFQAGLQLRSDDGGDPKGIGGRYYAMKFIKTGAIGKPLMVRGQWHAKNSWRAAAPTPEREKALNWRLDKNVSLGLMGEIGIHQLDQASWFLRHLPVAITGFGSILQYQDGREIPDTVQAVVEFPGGVRLSYDAMLGNSFDAMYDILYGSDAAIMIRDNREWLFQEVDCPQMGWEVYARKESFYKASGIVLAANASKLVVKPKEGEKVPEKTPIYFALENFLRNTVALDNALSDAAELIKDDPSALPTLLADVKKRPAAGYAEGLTATIIGIKANEAVLAGKRIELDKSLFELA
jgi:predicted dehydrogenase